MAYWFLNILLNICVERERERGRKRVRARERVFPLSKIVGLALL